MTVSFHTLSVSTIAKQITNVQPHQSYGAPKPYDPGQGCEKTADGILEPVWSRGPVLPPSLIDLLENTAEEADNNEDGNELLQIDYDELFDDDKAVMMIKLLSRSPVGDRCHSLHQFSLYLYTTWQYPRHCFIMSVDIDLVLGPLFIKFICIVWEYFSCQPKLAYRKTFV